MSDNPPTYPKDGTYADLLVWHLKIWWTRPGGTTVDRGKTPWDIRVFKDAIFKDDKGIDPEGPSKKYRSYTGGYQKYVPSEGKAKVISKNLFGGEIQFKRWEDDLDTARIKNSGKGKNVLTISVSAALAEIEQWISKQSSKGIQLTEVAERAAGEALFTHHQWHKFKAEPTNLNELLRTDIRATTLVGRSDELAMLSDWLAQSQNIAVKCIIGGAGAGKTRLAIELCEAAEADGWFATFLPSNELRSSHGEHSIANWTPFCPTLLVIDYAATSAAALKHWFGALALVRDRSAHKLRVLLLERHADRKSGWWADLLRPDSHTHATSADLIGAEMPHALPPLDAARDRRALLGEVMAKAAPLFDPPRTLITPPLPGDDPWFDQRLSDNGFDTGPLYLVMAGICAVDSGVPSALAMNRLGLAHYIAIIEQQRLQAFATARGFTDKGKLLLHVIACITLQNGCEPSVLPSLIKKERLALDMTAPFDDETVASIVCDLLPVVNKVEPVRPDLIGEVFCLSIIDAGLFREDTISQEIVFRCWERDSAGTIATLIFCASDLGECKPSHKSVIYLREIQNISKNIDQLRIINRNMPEDTLALCELAAETSFHIIRAQTQSGY